MSGQLPTQWALRNLTVVDFVIAVAYAFCQTVSSRQVSRLFKIPIPIVFRRILSNSK